MDALIGADAARRCCSCREQQAWRISLRNCRHVVCVSCCLEHLRIWIAEHHKARIKCPKKSCKARIHENDVRAVLDRSNRDLEPFMADFHRDWLLFHHDQDVIRYALGGVKSSRQCPLCKNFYAKVDGCNYVRCSNLRCSQWFCFECGDPVESWQHFAQGTCRVGWDDLFKLLYFVRFFLFIDTCTNCFIMPFMLLAILLLLPAYVAVSFPVHVIKGVKRNHYETHGNFNKRLLALKISLLSPFLIILGMFLGATTIFTSIPLCCLYFVLSMVKCIPPISHLFKVIDFAGMVLGVLGFSNWKQILQDAKAARVELEIDEQQEALEKSEMLKTLERNSQQEREHEAALAVKEARKDRAIGAAQCTDGAVDVGMVLKKGARNVEALQKGKLDDIQLIKITDVKINNAMELVSNAPKGKKIGNLFKR